MEIILKEDIIGLGFKNDIVNVKAGYGRSVRVSSPARVPRSSWLRISSKRLSNWLRSRLRQKLFVRSSTPLP